MTLEQYLADRAQQVEQALDHALPSAETEPKIVHEAMRYSCLGGGKRLRGIMAMAACRAVGGAEKDALGYAAALEMVHAYSLVHDDLPAMDDDDYRRGKPTNHKVYGEGMAVLVGDALLTQAMEQMAKLPELYPVTLPNAHRLLLALTKASGTRGMIGGQVMDLIWEGKSIEPDVLETIHKKKTGALFEVSLVGGAVIGGAKNDEIASLTRYAENFGLAFQITDDILDVEGDAAVLGKATGADTKQAKATYPGVFGLEEAKAMAVRCVKNCKAALASLSGDTWALEQLALYVLERDK